MTAAEELEFTPPDFPRFPQLMVTDRDARAFLLLLHRVYSIPGSSAMVSDIIN